MRCSPAADADELILEARDEGARAEVQRDVAAGAALERRAVHLAGEIDGDAVAVLGLGALALGGERPALLGDLRQGLVDLGVGHLGVQPFELDALEIRKLDRRQDLDRHRVGEVALALDHLLDRALVLRQRDLRLAHELEAALGDDLGVGLAHRRLDHLGHHRAPIQALEMGDRDLARTEAVDADLVLELAELGISLGGQIGGGDHDLELALEAVADSFGYLHHHNLLFCAALHGVQGLPAYVEPGSKTVPGVVRAEGLEPPRLASREPKSRASTSSATPARRLCAAPLAERRGLYHGLPGQHHKNRLCRRAHGQTPRSTNSRR